MKHRRIAVIISLLIALIGMFALPLNAQTNNSVTIQDLKYEGIYPNDMMVISWETVPNWDSVNKLQVKDGSSVNDWTSVSSQNRSTLIQGNRTFLSFPNYSMYEYTGELLKIRVRLLLKDTSLTPYAYVNQSLSDSPGSS